MQASCAPSRKARINQRLLEGKVSPTTSWRRRMRCLEKGINDGVYSGTPENRFTPLCISITLMTMTAIPTTAV